MKDNKGFTLVELLAAIVLLSLVLGIAGVGIGNVIKNARDRNEEIFVKKLEDVIDGYIDRYGSKLTKLDTEYSFNKCINGICDDSIAIELNGFSIKELVDNGYLDSEDLINPANSKKCFNDGYPSVRIFRDDEYVNYYYVDLSGDNTSCDISDKNGVINTLPDDLYNVIKAKGDIE